MIIFRFSCGIFQSHLILKSPSVCLSFIHSFCHSSQIFLNSVRHAPACRNASLIRMDVSMSLCQLLAGSEYILATFHSAAARWGMTGELVPDCPLDQDGIQLLSVRYHPLPSVGCLLERVAQDGGPPHTSHLTTLKGSFTPRLTFAGNQT